VLWRSASWCGGGEGEQDDSERRLSRTPWRRLSIE
jgi:hypothetical protein